MPNWRQRWSCGRCRSPCKSTPGDVSNKWIGNRRIEASRLLGFEKTYFILKSFPKYDTSNKLYVVRVQNYISLQNMYIYALYIWYIYIYHIAVFPCVCSFTFPDVPFRKRTCFPGCPLQCQAPLFHRGLEARLCGWGAWVNIRSCEVGLLADKWMILVYHF